MDVIVPGHWKIEEKWKIEENLWRMKVFGTFETFLKLIATPPHPRKVRIRGKTETIHKITESIWNTGILRLVVTRSSAISTKQQIWTCMCIKYDNNDTLTVWLIKVVPIIDASLGSVMAAQQSRLDEFGIQKRIEIVINTILLKVWDEIVEGASDIKRRYWILRHV